MFVLVDVVGNVNQQISSFYDVSKFSSIKDITGAIQN